MPKTARSVEQRFVSLSLHEQVRQAMPMAREILLGHGINCDPVPGEEMIPERVAKITGDVAWLEKTTRLGEDAHLALCEILLAAQALGIALGLSLRPEVFTDGAQ